MSKGSPGKWIEQVRRSQLITPYGIGAIMPTMSGETYMIAGLDFWNYGTAAKCDEEYLIKDERLTKRLGGRELRMPPDYRESGEKNRYRTIPVFRFPSWYYCPMCGSMERLGYKTENRRCNSREKSGTRTSCAERKFKPYLIPERLVMVCPQGHISDVNFMELVHALNPGKYNRSSCKLTRSSFGSSGSISNLKYTCSCGEERKFNSSMLQTGFSCNGAKPWLGIDEDHTRRDSCGSSMRITQSGSLNVWFPETISSILIPYDDNMTIELHGKIRQLESIIKNSMTDGKLDRDFLSKLFTEYEDLELVYATVMRIVFGEGLDDESDSEVRYRNTEYKALQSSSGNNFSEFHSVKQSLESYREIVTENFESISIVKKLKETRAFTGFSRTNPSTSGRNLDRTLLSAGKAEWLPAIQVFGEGVFLKFKESKIQEWKIRKSVVSRIEKLNANYRKSKYYDTDVGEVTPEYVMIHTFAHLLINQLSYECGYSAASIRERIYCIQGEAEKGDRMYGVLLYTASGDSEGSLGGLSRMGHPGYLEGIIENAIQNSRWCSADPICIQSAGQGPESTNLAACYSCSLLPETSCECGNRLLDRGLLIGDLDDIKMGFFNMK